jgi:hypothetical protein
MHNFNLTDETFDVNQSNNYFLLMQSSLDGFSYAVCDSVRNKCILLKHYDTRSADWFEYKNFLFTVIESDTNLKLHYKSSCHMLNQKDFTLVPEEYIPTHDQELQSFFPGSAGNLISSTSKSLKSAILCPYSPILQEALQKNFPGVKLTHVLSPFSNNLINESSRTLRHVFHFTVFDSFMIAGVAHSAKPDFLNSFKTETFEEVLYHIVMVLDKFKVSPALAEINIQNSSKIQDLNTRLQTYIGKVRNLKASNGMVYSYIFTEDVMERFANLLNLYHCE